MDPNMDMMSYLKIKKLVEDDDDDDESAEEDEEDDDADDDDVERESAVKDSRRTKKKRLSASAGEGGSRILEVAPPPCCLVESCQADLTGCKKYYQRHRVCEVHAKAPAVSVDGLRQRFCQQCSRFHEITEFDQTKRSCRRRLAGHNERRRKSFLESQKNGTLSRHLNTVQTEIATPGNKDFEILYKSL